MRVAAPSVAELLSAAPGPREGGPGGGCEEDRDRLAGAGSPVGGIAAPAGTRERSPEREGPGHLGGAVGVTLHLAQVVRRSEVSGGIQQRRSVL